MTMVLRGFRYVSTREYLSARISRDLEIEGRYLGTLRLRNGVFKSTTAHRMDDAIDLVARAAGTRPQRELRILDVACSSGVATVELHEGLGHAGFLCKTHGTDLLTEVELVDDPGKQGLVFDPEGHVLRVELESYSVPWPPLRSAPIVRALRLARAACYLGKALPLARRARREETPGYAVTRVPHHCRGRMDPRPTLRARSH